MEKSQLERQREEAQDRYNELKAEYEQTQRLIANLDEEKKDLDEQMKTTVIDTVLSFLIVIAFFVICYLLIYNNIY